LEIRPGPSVYRELSASFNLIPVWTEVPADMLTPLSAYCRLHRGEPSFLLESAEGGERVGRYSFLGFAPFLEVISREERTVAVWNGCHPEASAEAGAEASFTGHPLWALRRIMAGLRAPSFPELGRFFGGLVGYVAYDLVRHLERLPSPPPDDRGLPWARFLFPGQVAIFDHLTHRVKLLSLAPGADYERQVAEVEEMARRLEVPSPLEGLRLPSSSPVEEEARFVPSREEFLEAVRKAREYILAGEIFQVVLSTRAERPMGASPFSVYRVLRSLNPSPYLFYLDFGDLQLLGSSPEMLVRLEGGVLTTRPIAGTRPRTGDPERDRELEAELLADPKERAEHVMLVDLGRNDIGRVSLPGTVRVTSLMEVERYSHVMHIVSEVEGRLRPGLDAFDALAACFPAGTLTGAPKVRAMEIIDELEPLARGPYGGAVGYFGLGGDMDTAIAIRTVVISGGKAYVQAGAGVVADSLPEREWEECRSKARALLEALALAEGRSHARASSG